MSYINSTTEYWHPFCNKFSKNSGFIEGKGMMEHGASRHSQKGVTLIELVVVMAIIAIMAAFMAPSIGEWAAGFRLRGGTKDLADMLQLARIKAISSGNQYRVQLTINNGSDAESFVLQQNKPISGWTTEGSAINLPKGVNIDHVDPGNIQTGTLNLTFNTNGMNAVATTNTIYIENQRNDRYHVTMSQTGVVKMSDGW
jgi:prepilin-type N-terminal cleavage/methylation domain-containing protein